MLLKKIQKLKGSIPNATYSELLSLHFSSTTMYSLIYKHDLLEEYKELRKQKLDYIKAKRNEARNNSKALSDAEGSQSS